MDSSATSYRGALALKRDGDSAPLRLVPSTGHEPGPGALWSRTQTIRGFQTYVQGVITQWRAYPESSSEIAPQMLTFLKAFIAYEVGHSDLESGMGAVFHKLWGGGAQLRLLSDLYFRLQRIVNNGRTWRSSEEDTGYNLLADFEHVVQWYSVRKTSISILDEETEPEDPSNAFFGWHVVHDRNYRAMPGFDVVTGLRLSGSAYENLEVKVYFKEGSRFIKGRHSWVDATGMQFSTRSDERRVCGATPVHFNLNRGIIDEVRIFVPYAALGLEPGKQTVEVLTVLTNSEGIELVSRTDVHNFYIPPSLVPLTETSPHLLGVWERDFAHGDGILQAEAGRIEDIFAIWCTLSLANRDNETITLRCVPIRPDGFEIPINEEDAPGLKQYLVVEKPYEVRTDVLLSMPTNLLNLSGVRDEVLFNIVATRANGEVIFGTTVRGR